MTQGMAAAVPRSGPVALVGFMGVGKTAVGRALAGLLSVRFVDTDDLVTDVAGPIPEVFERQGEAGFRVIERDVVVAAVEAALADPAVLALGGGAVLDDDVREALRRLPHVVWLVAPAAVLWRRVSAPGRAARPLVRDQESFTRLLDEREAVYRSVATRTMTCDGSLPPDAVAAELALSLAESGTGGAAAVFRPAGRL